MRIQAMQAQRTAGMEKGMYKRDRMRGERAYPENLKQLYTEATGFRRSGTTSTARVFREVQAVAEPAPKRANNSRYFQ
jgi:hypothetical protein